MKKNLLLLLAAWLPLTAFCDKVTVHLETEGTLEEVISDQDVLKITDLTITGRFTASDIKYLRSGSGRVANLEILDLSGVTLVPSDDYYAIGGSGARRQRGDATITRSLTTYFYLSEDEKIADVSKGDGLGGITEIYNVYGMNLAGAFRGMNLKKVVLPATMKKIGDSCFLGCSELEFVELPNGIVAIEDNAFDNCKALRQLELPSSVEYVGAESFAGAGIESINLSYIKEVDFDAFLDCLSLKNIGSLKRVETIGKDAFKGCISLDKVTALENLKEISESAFSGCTSLVLIAFSDFLNSIGKSAFQGCTSINSIAFPGSLNSIGESAFQGCTALSELTFHEGIETIGEYAFRDCTALTELTLPEGLETIRASAFQLCSSLEEVHLPSTIKNLEYSSFAGTPWIDKCIEDDGMMVIGNIAVKLLIDEPFVENSTLVFREGIKGIADNFTIGWRDPETHKVNGYSFYWSVMCENITDIKFPSTLEYIGVVV